jgi:hypothetical protein
MHTYLLGFALYSLVIGGVIQFIDITCQSLRGARPQGVETTLYYGLNSTFALSQLLYGLSGVLLQHHALGVFDQPDFLVLSSIATAGWLTINLFCLDSGKPRLTTLSFTLLSAASAMTHP